MSTRILIVDNRSEARNAIRSLLHFHRFQVAGEASNGKEAIEKVRELRPGIVLLDINMPDINGVQAAYEIRRISPSTKILFFTIHDDEATSSARLFRVEGVVTKSGVGTQLIPAVRRLVLSDN